MKYEITQRYEGEWRPIKRRNYRLVCCDCGLAHIYNFRVRKGRLENQMFRDPFITRVARRRKPRK